MPITIYDWTILFQIVFIIQECIHIKFGIACVYENSKIFVDKFREGEIGTTDRLP